MKIIVNASPLIFLAKAGLLNLLKVFGDVYTTDGVMEEVLAPLKIGKFPDIDTIESAKWIKVEKLGVDEKQNAENLSEELGIGKGEAEVATLYMMGEYDLVVVADRRAQRKLEDKGIRAIDIIDVGWEASYKGKISIKEFATRIWKSGYRTERIEKILREL